MGITIPNVGDILVQKVQDIQSRLPIAMSLSGSLQASFADALAEAEAKTASNLSLSGSGTSADPLADNSVYQSAALLGALSPNDGVGTSTGLGTENGGYTATSSTFPKLDATQLQALMPRIDAAIEANAADSGIDSLLLRALIKQESSFQPFSLSKAGAMGLTQLMPDTAAGLGVDDPYNVEKNIRGGTTYLKQQLDTFGGDLTLALAAYNAGPNAVKEYGGVPPYQETKDFVQKVLSYYNMYRATGQT